MDREWLVRWRASMRETLTRLAANFEARFGYPPGVHEIGEAATEEELAELIAAHGPDLPADLLLFHQSIAFVRLPAVTNGYWIHRPPHTDVRYEPAGGRRLIVFGSDGGGALFALPAGSGTPVLRLPGGGAGTDVGDVDVEVVEFSANLEEFLGFLGRETAAFA